MRYLSPTMTVRRYRAEDAQGVVEAVKAVYDEYGFTWDPGDYHADLYDIPNSYAEPMAAFWVAEVEGRVAGCAALRLFPPIPGTPGRVVDYAGQKRLAGADCEMGRLYVRAECRRLGLGRDLARAVIAEAKARGGRLMEIWSDKRFAAAHSLYESLGAYVVGERVCHDPDQSPEWGLALKLR